MRKWTDDVALLLLRVAAGAIFIPHGYSKVFGEGGAAAFAADMPTFGMPVFLGYVAAYTEMFGAILLIAGLLTRLDAFLLACTMGVAAYAVKLPDVLYEVQPGQSKLLAGIRGMELELALLAMCVALVFAGGGRYSLDGVLRLEERVKSRFRRAAPAPDPVY